MRPMQMIRLLLPVAVLTWIASFGFAQTLSATDLTLSGVPIDSPASVLIQRWGNPDHTGRLYNNYAQDSDFVYVYDSLDVYLSGDLNILSFDVKSSRCSTVRGVGLGSSEATVMRRYGQPESRDSLSLLYREDHLGRGIIFYLTRQRVSQMYIGWFSD